MYDEYFPSNVGSLSCSRSRLGTGANVHRSRVTQTPLSAGADGDHRPQPFLGVIAHISLCVSRLLYDTLNVTDFCLIATSPRLLRKISQKMMHTSLPVSPVSIMAHALEWASEEWQQSPWFAIRVGHREER